MQLIKTFVFSLLMLFVVSGLSQAAKPEKIVTPDSETTVVVDSGYYKYKLDSMQQENDAQVRLVRATKDMGDRGLPQIIGILVPIVLFIGMAVVLYRVVDSTRQVKLAMVEKGMDPSLLKPMRDESSRKYSALRIGLLLSGIGMGLLVGWYLSMSFNVVEEQQIFLSIGSSLLLGGAGLALYHVIVSKMEKK